MIAVILNHLYGPVIYGRLTYPFELAGFFFTAGYTFDLTDSFFNFMRKKYALWQFLSYFWIDRRSAVLLCKRRIAASAHKGLFFANAWRLGCFMVRGLFIHNGTYVLSDCSVRFVFNNLFHVLHRIICLGVCVYDCFSDNSSMAYRKCVCYDSIPVFRICF